MRTSAINVGPKRFKTLIYMFKFYSTIIVIYLNRVLKWPAVSNSFKAGKSSKALKEKKKVNFLQLLDHL